MKEIEVKVIDINKEEMVKKLLDLGAEKVFEGKLVSNLYDFEDKSIKKQHSLLRLRKKEDKVFLTFKKSISKERVKIEEETETDVKDFETVDKILQEIGLLVRVANEKKRTTYKINNTLFEIDEVESIPIFMEIEAPEENIIFEYVKKLGIDKEKVKNWSGKEILEHYGKTGEI